MQVNGSDPCPKTLSFFQCKVPVKIFVVLFISVLEYIMHIICVYPWTRDLVTSQNDKDFDILSNATDFDPNRH